MPTQGRPPWPASNPPPMLDMSPCRIEIVSYLACQKESDKSDLFLKVQNSIVSLEEIGKLTSPPLPLPLAPPPLPLPPP